MRWTPQVSARRLPPSRGSPYAGTSLISKEYTMAPVDGPAIHRGFSCRHCVFLTTQDDPFIAPCCLLASPAQYRRAEPQQDSLPSTWVQLWLLRARPMAVMASTVRGTEVVYHMDGVDPGECHAVYCTAAHHCQRMHQRRRWPRGRLHNLSGQVSREERGDNAGAAGSRKRHLLPITGPGPRRAAVAAVTNGRFDGSTQP